MKAPIQDNFQKFFPLLLTPMSVLFFPLFPPISFHPPSHSPSSSPGAVVVGLDINFNYKKLALAELYIKNGAQFIGTNGDVNYPYARGAGEPKVLLPGGGVMVGALGMLKICIYPISLSMYPLSFYLLL